jgi:hypothetical protein
MRTLILLASACLVGGTVEAQATAQGRSRTVERDARRAEEATALRERVLERVMVADSAAMNRGTLGVTLGGAAHKRDTLGVFVEAVAEDGPAERAGIYEGHRIASINNVDVRASAADAGDAYLSGVGRHRLVRAMRDVSPGSTVTLRVWTGSDYRDVQVTTARFADVYKNQRFGGMWSDGTASGFGFGPAMEQLRITVPNMREFRLQPSREVRIEARPGQPDRITGLRPAELRRAPVRATATPRAPRILVAPSIEATPRMITVPQIEATPRVITVPRIAPTPSRRRFVI